MRRWMIAAIAGVTLAAPAYAEVTDFAKLTDILGAKTPAFQAQVTMDQSLAVSDRVLKLYYIPGKLRLEGTKSKTTYIAKLKEKVYYTNFDGANWIRMPMDLSKAKSTGIPEIDSKMISLGKPNYTIKHLKAEKLNGKLCDVTQIINKTDGRSVKVWEWRERHVPLQAVTNDGKMTFSNFVFKSSPASKFAPPQGAKVMALEELLKSMNGVNSPK